MKKSILILAMALVAINTNAQTIKVQTPSISLGKWDDIELSVTDHYTFSFSNDQYSHLRDWKFIRFKNKKSLNKFASLLTQVIENPNPSVRVAWPSYCAIIKNTREDGSVYITIDVSSGYEFLSIEETKSIVEVINSI